MEHHTLGHELKIKSFYNFILSAGYRVYGTKYRVHSAEYRVHGTEYRVHVSR